MYSSNHKRIGILGYVYLGLALIGIIYYIISYTISTTAKMTPEIAQLRAHCRTMLLFVSFIEIFTGIYIQSAQHKVLLFLQAMATMLLFLVHAFFIFAFFNVEGTIAFSSQNAIDAGTILLVVCALLHFTTLFAYRFKEEKPIEKSRFIDEELDFGDDL